MTLEQRLKDYEPLINKLSHQYSVPNYEPEDLKQEFRIILMTCHKNYDPSKAVFSTYFVNSCNNFVKNVYREQTRRPKIYLTIDDEMNEDGESHLIPSDMPEPTPLLDLMATLPNGAISILLLNGATQEEVSKQFGISQRKVGHKHYENINLLKEVLKRRGIGV
jgi:RNA polymerase sigma factor (sigma-70 family)